MLPTPSTSHVPYERVYEPAEDSYLLLDSLSSADESSFLKKHFQHGPSPLVCEVGIGSGVVLGFVAANAEVIFGRHDVFTLGTDLNAYACRSTSKTVQIALKDSLNRATAASTFLGAVNADLTSSLRAEQVDVLIFNPPYVPAPLPAYHTGEHDSSSTVSSFEYDSHLLELSYAGGEDGMEVTDRLLAGLPHVLSARGVAYILLCAQNKPRDVKARIEAWGDGWKAELVGSSGKTAGWEKLMILRIWRLHAV